MLTEVKKIKDRPRRLPRRDPRLGRARRRQPLRADARRGHRALAPRPAEHAEAAACFELGQHLWRAGDRRRAVPWFREAHRLDPENWTYKRQAWTFATTADGEPRPTSCRAPPTSTRATGSTTSAASAPSTTTPRRLCRPRCRGRPAPRDRGDRREVAAGGPDLGSPRREDGEQLVHVVAERVRDRTAHQICHLLDALARRATFVGQGGGVVRDEAAQQQPLLRAVEVRRRPRPRPQVGARRQAPVELRQQTDLGGIESAPGPGGDVRIAPVLA